MCNVFENKPVVRRGFKRPYASSVPIKLFLGYLFVAFSTSIAFANEDENARIEKLSVQIFSAQGEDKISAINALTSFEDTRLIPTFVLAMRWTGSNQYVAKALSEMTGENITHWHQAYEWQEQHPEIKPHDTFNAIKLRFLGNTDKRFNEVLSSFSRPSDSVRIRLEEIVWGGVLFDGIPSLDRPSMIAANDEDYLAASDLVFGVSVNGDARAYPLRVMGWHEMLNDVIGGVSVSLAYCTLCGSGILFETSIEGQVQPLVFGTSGLLYRSNKLMFDRETESLWNQFTGEPVVGPLAKTDVKLKTIPMVLTTWEEWKFKHKHSTVLSLQTGYVRDYNSGVTYNEYFNSPDLMFPVVAHDEATVKRKSYVFGLQSIGASKAWPVMAFIKQPVINDQVGIQRVVLVGDEKTRTVRAYERMPGEEFQVVEDGRLMTTNEEWLLSEEFLLSVNSGQRRRRIAGRISYWFAWQNFVGPKTELYQFD